jgi:dihydroxy-acid dehydratase
VAPKHYSDFKAGHISADEFCRIQDRGCPGIGACPVMGTANTMAAMAEALGMTLPGNATVPGADSRLLRLAFSAGQHVVHLHQQGVKSSDVLGLDAFKNAIRVLMATGGSTNAVLHLQAIAAELDLVIEPEIFNEMSSTTPFICDVAPSGTGGYLIGDLDEAGGITAVMKELQSLLCGDAMTVTGNILAQNLEQVPVGDRRVIHAIDSPLAGEGGLLFLRGNLAPDGALIKQSAVPAEMFQHSGPAKIFPDEETACDALIADEISAGEIVVVRYVGPKGDPGMRLLQRFLWLLAARDMQTKIAFITDGRFSGTNKGCAVAHITPEAAVGGPLALVQDGDIIQIDIPNKQLNIDLAPEELKKRQEAWRPPSKKANKGYLSIYSRLAKPADKGAALDYDGE